MATEYAHEQEYVKQAAHQQQQLRSLHWNPNPVTWEDLAVHRVSIIRRQISAVIAVILYKQQLLMHHLLDLPTQHMKQTEDMEVVQVCALVPPDVFNSIGFNSQVTNREHVIYLAQVGFQLA